VAAGAARSSALAALAIVQAPPYTPAVLRGALDETARRFQEAMRLYVRKDYEGAKARLRAAAALDPGAPDIAFFLGICALLTDEPAAAIAELRRTVALGESPYLEEAHFYLAKAHVRRGELTAAASQIEATVRLRGDREQEAREMLQKLESFRGTSR
jgi:tetratricopeptide (TPR) repeat protein